MTQEEILELQKETLETVKEYLDNLIPAMKEQNSVFFEEDEDLIKYHYTIDVAVLLKNNFQDLLK